MSTDRELLELAAKAAGLHVDARNQASRDACGAGDVGLWIAGHTCWNPLTDDGDALRLAVRLEMQVRVIAYGGAARIDDGGWSQCEAHLHGGIEAATRRAIVRAAAEIGKGMA